MAKVEIDAQELALLRAGHKMLDQLYSDPDKGLEFKKLIKTKFPSAQVPDLDAVSATEKMLKPIIERLDKRDADEAKRADDAKVNDLQSRFDRVTKDRGLTEEGQKKLLGIMKDRGISNPEDAVVIFERDLPKATKASKPYSSRMDFVTQEGEKDADFDKLMRDPDAFMIDGMVSALRDSAKDKE